MQSFPYIKLDQIGLKRSTSWFLIWERISGDMGRSDSISLRKDGEGKYLERGNIFLQRVQNKRRKRRKVFLERKYFLRAGWKSEKEKEENNWRRKIFFVEEMGRKSRALQEVLADLKIESVNNCILSLTYQALIIICRRSAKAFSFNCRPEFESTARITLYGVYWPFLWAKWPTRHIVRFKL